MVESCIENKGKDEKLKVSRKKILENILQVDKISLNIGCI